MASREIKDKLTTLFSLINKPNERDLRYLADPDVVTRCQKGLEYLEKASGTSLTIRYWCFNFWLWYSFLRLIKKLSNLEELRIIGCQLDDKKLADLVSKLKSHTNLKIFFSINKYIVCIKL
jgi:hypothetical protein